MKFLAIMIKAINRVWTFFSRLFSILVFMAFILFVAAIIVPDNVAKAIDIVRSIF